MRPTFTSTQISSVSTAGTGRDSYLISWDMDTLVTLKLTNASLETNAPIRRACTIRIYIFHPCDDGLERRTKPK